MSRKKEVVGTEKVSKTIYKDGDQFPVEDVKEHPIYKTIYICDWCGKESDKYFLDGDMLNDQTFECEFYAVSGSGIYLISKPGRMDKHGFTNWKINDLCRDCIERLRLLLIEQGVTLSEVDF